MNYFFAAMNTFQPLFEKLLENVLKCIPKPSEWLHFPVGGLDDRSFWPQQTTKNKYTRENRAQASGEKKQASTSQTSKFQK